MALQRLDHVNIRTARLEDLTAFYRDILGLQPGKRPPFRMGGAWLYCGDRAAVHLVEVEKTPEVSAPRLEHFAFQAEGMAEFIERLQANKVDYEIFDVPDWNTRQVFLYDPEGNHIEVQFSGEEASALGL